MIGERMEGLVECVESVLVDLNPVERAYLLRKFKKWVEGRYKEELREALGVVKGIFQERKPFRLGHCMGKWYPVSYVKLDEGALKERRPRLYGVLVSRFPKPVRYDNLVLEEVPVETQVEVRV